MQPRPNPNPSDGLDLVALLLLMVLATGCLAFALGQADRRQSAIEAELTQARLEGRVVDIPLEWLEEQDHPDYDGVEQ